MEHWNLTTYILLNLRNSERNPFSLYLLSWNFTLNMVIFIFWLIFFKRLTFVGSAWSFGFFIPATTANDLRLRRIFYPRFYPLHLFSYLNSWKRASIFPFECSLLNKGTTGTIFITSLVWQALNSINRTASLSFSTYLILIGWTIYHRKSAGKNTSKYSLNWKPLLLDSWKQFPW